MIYYLNKKYINNHVIFRIMNWKKFPLWLKIESMAFALISVILLVFGFIMINPDTGIAILAELMLPTVGILIGLWILSYSILKNSWKFLVYGECVLIVTWFILWILFD